MNTKNRLQFIDFHRGLVLIIMIEVHVFNALMNPLLKSTFWYHQLNFINGLVAPSFLFISGFAFVLAAEKKLPEFKKFGSVFWKQLSRIGLILLVGYSLRVPFFSLKRTMNESTPDQWAAFYSVDVLQTIAIGLLFMFALRLLIKSDTTLRFVSLILTIIIGILTPIMWGYDFQNLFHPIIANYLNPMHQSLFPLFPWMGFLTIGAYTSLTFIQYRKEQRAEAYFKRLFWTAIILIVTGHLFITKSFPTYIELPDPHFFFFSLRVGYVLLILYIAKICTDKVDFTKYFILDVSRDSLLIYWLHLQVLYRKWWNDKSITDVVNSSFGPGQCILVTVGLVIIMMCVAVIWSDIKRVNPVVGKYIARFVIWGSVGFFLIR